MVSRSAWGARPFRCSEPLPKVDTIVIHYTAANSDEQEDHANCAGRVRGIQNFHLDNRGWCDIAYNFLVCKHGEIFAGRGYGRKSGATGAANSHTLAVCFLGDDTANRDDVTAAGRTALGRIVRAAMAKTGATRVKGHRDFMSTSCPGDELMSWIEGEGWKLLSKYRYELWIEGVRRARSSWYIPGGGQAKERFKRFYEREDVRELVRKAQRKARFRHRKG